MKNSLSLSEFRSKHGVTQVQLAEMLEITPEYVSMIENGKKTASQKILNKLGFLDGVKFTKKKLAYQTNRNGVVPGSLSLHDNSEEYMSLPDGPCKNCALLQAELDAVKEQLSRQNSVIDKLLQK